MRLGMDASFAGTTQDFDQAYQAGIRWVGHYFGGAGVYRVWSNAERLALKNSLIQLNLPIWVPNQSFTSNPVTEAVEAIAAARALGIKQVIAVDVEENSGYTLAWGEANCNTIRNAGYQYVMYHGGDKQPPSQAHSWLAFWTGNPPSSLAPGTAQQYRGGTAAFGMSVDFDSAADDFPLEGLAIVPPTNTTTKEKDDMGLYIFAPTTAGDPAFISIDGCLIRLPDTSTVATWEAQGAKPIPTDHAMVESLLAGMPKQP